MCDAHLCPLVAAYDAAEMVVSGLGDLHENPALARGAIAAYRRTQEAARDRYPCDGPVTDHNNEMACPLGQIRHIAGALATVPIQRTGWAFDPEKLVNAETDSQSGQYL
jgi:hypothetical protein